MQSCQKKPTLSLRGIIALLLLFATTLGGGISGQAAGAIAPDTGSLTIHKYLYDVGGIGDGFFLFYSSYFMAISLD